MLHQRRPRALARTPGYICAQCNSCLQVAIEQLQHELTLSRREDAATRQEASQVSTCTCLAAALWQAAGCPIPTGHALVTWDVAFKQLRML